MRCHLSVNLSVSQCHNANKIDSMRKMRKIDSLIMIVCFCTNLTSYGFVESKACQIKVENQKVTTDSPETVKESNTIKIASIDLFCWWFSDEQIRKGFYAENAPPKNTYTKLEVWNAYTEALHPDKIDIVSHVENGKDLAQELIIEVEISFKVESWEKVTNDSGSNEEILKSVPWTEKVKINPQKIILQPKEKTTVNFKDFNLGESLDKCCGDRDDDLWAWFMKVQVTVRSINGKKLAEGEKILHILPAD